MCHRKPVLTTAKETCFLLWISVSLIWTDGLLLLRRGENLYFTFHLSWSGNFQDFLLIFPSATHHGHPQLDSLLLSEIYSWSVSLKASFIKVPSHLQVLEIGFHWNGGKQSYVFVSNFSTAGDPRGIYELLCRGERIHWHWCVFHRHDENCLETLNVGPGDQGTGSGHGSKWLNISPKPGSHLISCSSQWFFAVDTHCIFQGRHNTA